MRELLIPAYVDTQSPRTLVSGIYTLISISAIEFTGVAGTTINEHPSLRNTRILEVPVQ
jgi:hypothetical protein